MRIRIKKLHQDAVIPRYAHFGDAAVDLVAVRKWEDEHGNVCYGTGLAMEIPENHVGLFVSEIFCIKNQSSSLQCCWSN